jgi:hypothetical protein
MKTKARGEMEQPPKGAPELVDTVRRALASMACAEERLRTLRLDELPAMESALEAAAADAEALRRVLPAAGLAPHQAALRPELAKLARTSLRVSVLYASARCYHTGLAGVPDRELAGYDAVGAVRDLAPTGANARAFELQG